MKLFTRDIDKKLFAQYPKGSSLENQVVVAKIFNPYGAGRWYLLNSDPSDPDYLWAIVQINGEPETGSVSRKQLENIRVKPFNLPLERDLYFSPINALELYQGLLNGKIYKAGGMTEASENKEMLLNQSEEFEHHAEELESAVKKADHIPAWVVAKSERASTDLSDITHYLDGENEQREEMTEGEEEYADGGEIKWQDAHYGDNALVVSENKMGIIIKPYGRKFHLKFPDGTEKTYDASELKFFGDMDDFDRGGEMFHGGEVGGLSADEAIYLYIKKAINQPYREKYLKPAGLWNTPKMKEVEQSLKKKGYLNGAGAINETGKNKAREVDASVDRIISREYISSNNPKAVYSEIVEKFHSDGKMASGGKLDVGRYYKTTDGRQVRYLGDTKDPEVGTFTNKADGVLKVRYDEIEGKASLFEDGGEVEEGVDLFEDYDNIPSNVQEVLDKYSDAFEDGDYKELEKANKELGKIGYTFEYGLDGQAYDLRKVGEKGKSEYMAKGGQTDFGDFYEWSSKEVNNKFNSQFDEGFPIVKFVKDSVNKVVESASGVLKNGKTVVFNVDSVEWKESDKMASGGMMANGGMIYFDEILPSEKLRELLLSTFNLKKIIIQQNEIVENPRRVRNFYETIIFIPIINDNRVAKINIYIQQKPNAYWYIVSIYKTMEQSKYIFAKDGSPYLEQIPPEKLYEFNIQDVNFSDFEKGLKSSIEKNGIYDFKTDSFIKMASGGMMAKGGKTDSDEVVYIEFLNAKKGFSKDKKYFRGETAYNDAVKWGRKNIGNFNMDMVKFEMAMGGKVKFADKVKSVKKSLLERKKVSPKVQKDYGKTYSPKEAEESAKRIVGAMTAKERLMAKRKKSKK